MGVCSRNIHRSTVPRSERTALLLRCRQGLQVGSVVLGAVLHASAGPCAAEARPNDDRSHDEKIETPLACSSRPLYSKLSLTHSLTLPALWQTPKNQRKSCLPSHRVPRPFRDLLLGKKPDQPPHPAGPAERYGRTKVLGEVGRLLPIQELLPRSHGSSFSAPNRGNRGAIREAQ